MSNFTKKGTSFWFPQIIIRVNKINRVKFFYSNKSAFSQPNELKFCLMSFWIERILIFCQPQLLSGLISSSSSSLSSSSHLGVSQVIGQVLPGAREVERWVTHLFLPPGEIQECNIKRRKKLFSTNEKAKGPKSAVIGDAHL